MILELLLLLGLAGLAVLALAAIMSWIDSNKTTSSSYARVVKSKLASGKYRIVTGIFSTSYNNQATKTWEVDELDDDLRDRFGYSDDFTVHL